MFLGAIGKHFLLSHFDISIKVIDSCVNIRIFPLVSFHLMASSVIRISQYAKLPQEVSDAKPSLYMAIYVSLSLSTYIQICSLKTFFTKFNTRLVEEFF